MRPPRLALLIVCFAASSILIFRSLTAVVRATISSSQWMRSPPRLPRLFSFNSPLTLFPPNAAISLTDDNSTSFPARPAAFGPSLPIDGLSGQLWIGSGFADDNLQEGEGEGELGCSDIPGWEDGISNIALKFSPKPATVGLNKDPAAAGKSDRPRRRTDPISPLGQDYETDPVPSISERVPVDDGTDDYLQQEISIPPRRAESARSSGVGHADIQSIQEAAEIAGKIVLLSRGGCGFLEKTKWAQRRGAKALIVGDNRKGGPLIQMFARGDTSNVTIPSVFTARTTAHLLSSLTQPGTFIEDTIDENGHPSFKVQQSDASRKRRKKSAQSGAGNLETQPASTGPGYMSQSQGDSVNSPGSHKKRGWLSWLLHGGGSSAAASGKSGETSQDWVVVEEWDDLSDRLLSDSLQKGAAPAPGVGAGSEDSFSGGSLDDPGSRGGDDGTPRGGDAPTDENVQAPDSEKTRVLGGLLHKLFGEDGDKEPERILDAPLSHVDEDDETEIAPPEREGLWVTITPTSSAGSFFDTLLVLVISPLITLTVVYALVMIRARIRRRRWRAPKSVIDRLPVRTYQTVATTPVHSPRVPTPTSSSPTTPLLQGTPSRSRPRSQTTTGVPDSSNLVAAPQVSNEWKKYMGRQVECVVCLEEYIDGVSRVMSLPCGHEFHAECITPWLTTRRRTCPICKGDVVRSLARGTHSSARHDTYRDSSDEEETRPPVRPTSGASVESQLERGISVFPPFPAAQTPANRMGAWFGSLTSSLAGSFQSNSPEPEDLRTR